MKDFPIVEHCLDAILEVNKDNMSYIISYMILRKLSLKRMVLYTCALHGFFQDRNFVLFLYYGVKQVPENVMYNGLLKFLGFKR